MKMPTNLTLAVWRGRTSGAERGCAGLSYYVFLSLHLKELLMAYFVKGRFGSSIFFCITLILLIAPGGMAQDAESVPDFGDTLRNAATEAGALPVLLATDTVFNYPTELVADQIGCLQGEVPLQYNKTVQSFIKYLTFRKRSYTKTMLVRKEIYFPIFEAELKNYGLPAELKYLPIPESGLNPRAVSPARAVGLWQFMSPVGKQYGLNHDAYVDERMDPYKSTKAGCQLLKWLYKTLGDWELVLASYNCGIGTVRRAIRRSGNKKNFWEIYPYLPKETRSYVPMFVAVAYVMNHPEMYNFRTDSLPVPVASDTILVNQFLDLELVAGQLNIPLKDIQFLNPQFKSTVIPGHLKPYPLRLPVDVLPVLAANRQSILDSASRPASREPAVLMAGTASAEAGSAANPSTSSEKERRKIIHKVTRGDVLSKVAAYYDVAVADVRRWNGLRGNTVKAGQRLAIWVQKPWSKEEAGAGKVASLPKALPKKKVYLVQPGDTLWSISSKHGGISVDRIKKVNHLKSNRLKTGQKLILS
jgi:membrane-bound lytic murein transglycosylase D